MGLKNYFTAVPCKNGHVDYRQVSNRTCHSCRREAIKRLPENYYIEYRQNNKESISEYSKEYALKNPELKKTRIRNYRARKRSAEGSHTSDDVIELLNKQKFRCSEPTCRANLKSSGYHVDHIIPLSKGGTNWPSNLQCLCPHCNFSKSNIDPIDWANRKGRLL